MMNTIFIVAGETSGDKLGGLLAHAIKQQQPDCHLLGVGSTAMKTAGVEIIINSDQLAVMGFFEVLQKFKIIRHCFKKIISFLKQNPPDLLILIDYPGFNLRLATRAKALGIKVMYYVSPQIWAWHYSRIKRIKRDVDLMAVLFSFEEKIYQKEQVPVLFVGHPLIETIKPTLTTEEAHSLLQLDPQKITIGLLPGSRSHEIERLLPPILAAAKLIKKQIPNAQFILPLAPNLSENSLASYDLSDVTVVRHYTYDAISLCQAAIVTSGTVTLEVALLQVPMMIIYKINPLTAFVAQFITDIKQFGLCNIVAEEPIVLELLQDKVTPEAISSEIIKILQDQEYHQNMTHKLSRLQHKLKTNDAAIKAAKAAIELIS